MGLPTILDQTRVPLRLHEHLSLTGTVAERRLADLAGLVTLPAARRLDLWKYIRWLLPFWDRLSFQMQHQQQANWCWLLK